MGGLGVDNKWGVTVAASPPVRQERVRMGHPGVLGQGRKGKITGGPPADSPPTWSGGIVTRKPQSEQFGATS
jgi:hypothetical protein